MKKRLSTIILILVFLVGLGIMLYPTIADHWNRRVQSRVIADYEAVIATMSPEDNLRFIAEADEYNRALLSVNDPLVNHDVLANYDSVLDISGQGVIGYITIDKLGVELPIYHGTSDAVLSRAAGHLKGSSFPVGGESTHAIISAHRGLPSARLFTDLDRMELDDTFRVTVLDRVLTYRVDSILIVLPDQIDTLAIVPGEDHITLVTCTPYGINTHRLLVRGTRVETGESPKPIYVANEAFRIDPVIVAPIMAIPMLFALLVYVLIKYRKKRNKEYTKKYKRK